ncbi:DEAD/DEAH box helicase [Thermodesulfobacteriota bacterium]
MLGKVLEFKKSSVRSALKTELPESIRRQFKTEVLERGIRSAKASRISHINFGRESYFGLVSDSSSKPVNVHIILNPESKTLTKATCGCFRSNTRTYCHHIVSFVKYILRGDPETGRLRTLEQDFKDSFWHEISWYGFRHFGDSTLGFKARVDHGADGLRLGFSERNEQDILAFMPGHRLVEEFLHEFFDIVRRDIDPVLFKRMYGRKLKDPKVPSQRRRPWTYAESEEELNKRGLKSAQQHHEDSMWHRIAKVGFLISGRDGGRFTFTFLEHKQQLLVETLDEDDEVIIRLIPPRAHIGTMIGTAEKKEVIGHDLFIHPQPLNTGYRVAVTDSSSLCITPVVENPDLSASSQDRFLDRTEIESQLFGSYYFFPDWGFFRIASTGGGLPSEHFSTQKKTFVPPEEITTFLEEYGDVLRQEPGIQIDDDLLHRRTVKGYKKATVTHKEFSDEGVLLEVSYDFGDTKISFHDIYEARSSKTRFLVRDDKWIDVFSSDFTWMDSLDRQADVAGNLVRMSRSDYLRFLALHRGVTKRFSSKRVRSWFEELQKLKPPTRLPSLRAMKGKLRGYQRNGFGWLWFLYENGFSGLLCDDMGLGKTHQVMALMTGIAHRMSKRPSKLRFLVICPTSVLSHWYDKIMEFAPDLDPYIYHGTDRSFRQGFEEHRTIVTSYGIALRDIEMFADYRFELIVLDEIQAVKNKSTKTYAAVKALQAVSMVGLTGTPIENSLKDIKALFDIIIPGYLMTDSLFENHFRYPVEELSDRTAEKRLSSIINPFVLRRKKEQVLKELPPKIEDTRRCLLEEDQIRFYRDVVENQGARLVQKLKSPEERVPYMHIFSVLNSLKQICNHPALLEKENKDYEKYRSGKWDLFVEVLQESLGSGQKVVVFSQYVKMLELIESYLRDHAIDFTTIKGHTRKRAEAIKRFNTDPECMVFTASLRASGLGIDLTGGSVVIHYDRWWNAAREEQATDRVHRIGQRRGVHVFKLMTENTLEERIDRIIAKKKRLMESVVKQDDKTLLKHFSREELIELISC